MVNAFDFSPLFRSTIGFDRLTNLLETAARHDEAANGFPPYNIEKTDSESYRITMAVAGFTEDDLSVEIRDGRLIVSGKKAAEEAERRFLHRGVALRPFQRIFQLADHVKVLDASLDNGLLHIDLQHELPEEKKPRQIEISTGAPASIVSKAKKLVEGGKKNAA